MHYPPSAFRRLASTGLGMAACLLLSATAGAEPSSVPPELGYNYGEQETPRMTAVAGALRATGNSTSALFSNPANMAASKVYHLGAVAQIYPESARQSYGGAIVDSIISSTGLAGGFAGIWSQQDPDGLDREWMDLRFGLALPVGDVLFLGLTGRHLSLTQNGLGPLGTSYASGGIPNAAIINTVTFDAGVTLRPIEELSIALVGHNLTNSDTSLLPIMGAAALGFATDDFSLGADVVMESRTYDDTNFRFQTGGEVLIADRVALRGGYRFDPGPESHALSGGLGYIDRKFSVDAAVRRSISGPGYTAVTFGFTIHIESMSMGPAQTTSY